MRIKGANAFKGLGTGCLAFNKLLINHSCNDFDFDYYYGRIRKKKKIQQRRLRTGHQEGQGGGNHERGVSWKPRGKSARKERDITQKGTGRPVSSDKTKG